MLGALRLALEVLAGSHLAVQVDEGLFERDGLVRDLGPEQQCC